MLGHRYLISDSKLINSEIKKTFQNIKWIFTQIKNQLALEWFKNYIDLLNMVGQP